MAAMLAFGMSACQKGEPGNGVNGPVTGSRMGLTIALPDAAFAPTSRAEQDAIEPSETAVATVDVWVFNADGTKAETGAWTSRSIEDDFTQAVDINGDEAEDNVYTLNEGSYIVVEASKNARVYIGVNVPTDKAKEYETEKLFLAETDIVKTLATAEAFTMFSPVQIVPLEAYIAEKPESVTEVIVNVDRVVSKVVATTETVNITPRDDTNAEVEFAAGVKLTYAVTNYNVYNEALDSYLVKQANTKSTLNSFDNSYLKDAEAPANGNKAVIQMNKTQFDSENERAENLTGLDNMFYIGENNSQVTSGVGLSTVGTTTYAFVSTTVTVSKTAVWNEGEGAFEWTGAANAAGADIYVVQQKDEDGIPFGETYICLTDAFEALEPAHVSVNYFKYKEGYVHFLVWLNHESENKAIIGRNEFIHLHVEGITGSVGSFPGYPGTEDDAKKPIDPTEKENNPEEKGKDDPIDPLPSHLKVEITVNPWTYMDNYVILSK